MSIRRACVFLLALGLPLALLGCMSPKGASPDEKRSYVRKMRNDTLRDVYKQNPKLEQEIRGAAGYAVFSNLSVKIFLLGPGHGYGMLVENAKGKETFMRMAQLSAGVGMGVRTMRVLFIFRDPKTMATFRDSGWQFGGDANVAAQAGKVGGSVGTQGKVAGSGASVGGSGSLAGDSTGLASGVGMSVYEFTDAGLALTAGVAGTRYWKNAELN